MPASAVRSTRVAELVGDPASGFTGGKVSRLVGLAAIAAREAWYGVAGGLEDWARAAPPLRARRGSTARHGRGLARCGREVGELRLAKNWKRATGSTPCSATARAEAAAVGTNSVELSQRRDQLRLSTRTSMRKPTAKSRIEASSTSSAKRTCRSRQTTAKNTR